MILRFINTLSFWNVNILTALMVKGVVMPFLKCIIIFKGILFINSLQFVNLKRQTVC